MGCIKCVFLALALGLVRPGETLAHARHHIYAIGTCECERSLEKSLIWSSKASAGAREPSMAEIARVDGCLWPLKIVNMISIYVI